MMLKLTRNFRAKLCEIDLLYQQVIVQLSIPDRINYCESLIYRTKEDLAATQSSRSKKDLKKILRAGVKELEQLQICCSHTHYRNRSGNEHSNLATYQNYERL
ncbi:hypothetical protein [Aquimarina addita]